MAERRYEATMSIKKKLIRFFYREKRSVALNQLDLKLHKYLQKSKGFFVECGANDGISQSNTFYFEKYYGWRGLLIEPLPHLAERCRRRRKHSIVRQCALVSDDYPGSTIEIRDCNLMSVVCGAMNSAKEVEQHLERGRQVQNLDMVQSLEVPARTLSSLLDEHGVTAIDFLSLDVEGYEAPALRGLDLERHAPQWMLIEANYKEDIDTCLRNRYDEVGYLSHHDVLYRLKH